MLKFFCNIHTWAELPQIPRPKIPELFPDAFNNILKFFVFLSWFRNQMFYWKDNLTFWCKLLLLMLIADTAYI